MSATTIDPMTIARWTESLRDERDAEAIYLALAEAQTDLERRALLERIAADERRHAAYWDAQLRAAGVDPSNVRPGQRARILCRLADSTTGRSKRGKESSVECSMWNRPSRSAGTRTEKSPPLSISPRTISSRR